MIKCFLSHSSIDKESYVKFVAKNLRNEVKIYDTDTFEAGMSAAEEIINGLDKTSLFVIFLSNTALESAWVKDELKKAKILKDNNKIDRIYPIIIDKNVTHRDKRIPKWMKECFNLQHITQPKIAARKINSRLREIAWETHPKLREREKIFVGRNKKINELEERLDDYTKDIPVVIIASGLPKIGRKTFLHHSLKKANILRESYALPLITFNESDSIEDFILKLNDTGLVNRVNLEDSLKLPLNEKVDLLVNMLKEISNEDEKILVEDQGAIIQYNGKISEWFNEVVNGLIEIDKIILCISSRFRVNKTINFKNYCYYSTEIPELEKTERSGLLVRYSKFMELNLKKEDISFFSDILSGYPEQVFFAVDLIKQEGIFSSRKQSDTIQKYSSDKAKILIDQFKNDKKKIDYLYFLSKFEFVSYELAFKLSSEKEYFPILTEFINSSICEQLGTNADYIRVNEVIRDYIRRNKIGIPDAFKSSIKSHVEEYIKNFSDNNSDISDYMFSIQHALLNNIPVDEKILIPSYFLKTIKTLYEEKNYQDAINLADRALLSREFIDSNIINHIIYIKCQCLARIQDDSFFSEARNIVEPKKSFLYGFYYRLAGRHEEALKSYNRVLERTPSDQRAKNEIILIYMQSDEPELAYDMAKAGYDKHPTNYINANNYFNCLIKRSKTLHNKNILEDIISNLESSPSKRAQEIAFSAQANLYARYDNNEEKSLAVINRTIEEFPTITYPALTKADIAIYFENVRELESAINHLDSISNKKQQTYKTFIKYKVIYFAMTGDKQEAMKLVDSQLKGLRKSSINKLISKIDSYS